MTSARFTLVVASVVMQGMACEVAAEGPIRVGSKSFTESVILGEMAAQIARQSGYQADHIMGLGGTRLLWEALLAGQIDVYAEYTGTVSEEILAGRGVRGVDAIREHLRALGLDSTQPLGFNNTYALGMKKRRADDLGIATISDLRAHGDLIIRFSNEFMQRGDGWPALSQRYRLPHEDVRGMEHALAYASIDKGVIDVTDLYVTDAKIRKLKLRALRDDLGYFPGYEALFIYRAALEDSCPKFIAALQRLEGRIDDAAMTDLNALVELEGRTESAAAARFLADEFGFVDATEARSPAADLWRWTVEHLQMVIVSMAAATIVAIPLGMIASRKERLAQIILGVVGIIQTIPSIALLVMLIRPVSWFSDELGYPQAVVALFLYSLLPIVRNTYTGLHTISPGLVESAVAIGLPAHVRMWRIELPLASRTILAGLKTAAVINVGFATLGGFIGAGGFGDPIFTGIRLNDYPTILSGAIPAALLALAIQGLFEVADRFVVPRGLRLRPGSDSTS